MHIHYISSIPFLNYQYRYQGAKISNTKKKRLHSVLYVLKCHCKPAAGINSVLRLVIRYFTYTLFNPPKYMTSCIHFILKKAHNNS